MLAKMAWPILKIMLNMKTMFGDLNPRDVAEYQRAHPMKKIGSRWCSERHRGTPFSTWMMIKRWLVTGKWGSRTFIYPIDHDYNPIPYKQEIWM
jgi:hypothetical protein